MDKQPRKYSDNKDKETSEEKQDEGKGQTEKRYEDREPKGPARTEKRDKPTEEEDELAIQQRKENKARRDRERREMRIKNKVSMMPFWDLNFLIAIVWLKSTNYFLILVSN